MPLLNYTTQVDAARTVSQIQATLARHGARSIMIEYDDGGTARALSFIVATPHGEIGIRLPINPEAVLKVLQKQRVRSRADRAQAVRIAWRIVKDWTDAQMAILETEMVKMEQVFLPYMVMRDGQTLFQTMENKHFLLNAGKEEVNG